VRSAAAVLFPDECDWERLGVTGGGGVRMPSSLEASGRLRSGGGSPSKSESWLGAGNAEGFIEVA
jgi:hypothetical protein